ncbi:MAG: hypothetical protein HN742_00530 [Lentisphaerae bacterium]|nr:hypothetical protein [Lentisphaerota bacterium]MBT4819377.1 hypothetical protein [Lentisphaerota bacterium]MBT5607149.1 hypothetical protein [Lentisphaerota bacterium]MBT7059479.1 hypothetical protein [Lentisphaerota bacterium]MBT7840316.1 hypothetical protein [Lentisphaerota bacterium]
MKLPAGSSRAGEAPGWGALYRCVRVLLLLLPAGCVLVERREVLLGGPSPLPPPSLETVPEPSPLRLDGVAPELALALLVWQADPIDAGGEGRALGPSEERHVRKLNRAVCTARANHLIHEYRPLLALDSGGRLLFRPTRIGPRKDAAATHRSLLQLRDEIRGGFRIRPAGGDPDVERRLGLSRAASFKAWLAKRPEGLLVSGAPSPFLSNRDALEGALASLQVKRDIVGVLSEADRLAADGAVEKAFRLVRHFDAQPEVAAAMARIGDTVTEPRLHETTESLARAFVSAQLAKWRSAVTAWSQSANAVDGEEARIGVQRAIGDFEKRIVEVYKGCVRDARLANALREQRQALRSGLFELALVRASLAKDDLVRLVDAQRAWDAFDVLEEQNRSVLETIVDGENVYGLTDSWCPTLQPVAEQAVHRALFPIFAQVLPSAFEAYLRTADRQVSNFLRHGTSLALCAMLEAMVMDADEEELPKSVRSRLPELKQRRRKSTRFFLDKIAGRRVIVEAFSCGIPGLGKAYGNDLVAALTERVKAAGAGAFVDVRGAGEEAPSADDYVIAEGHIADFHADEITEVETMRLEQRWGKIEEQVNPTYGRLMPGGGEDKRPVRFRQVLSEHVINQRTVERIAHIRLTFRVRHRNAEDFGEVNEFFRRSFVQEGSHPFRDVRTLQAAVTFDRDTLHPEAPPPPLRKDRIWTPAEMLDWGRRQSLEQVGKALLLRLRSYPLNLATEASALATRDDWAEASNKWGFCHAYLTQSPGPPSPGDRVTAAADRAPDREVPPIHAGSQLDSALLSLRGTVFADMVNATRRFLEAEPN